MLIRQWANLPEFRYQQFKYDSDGEITGVADEDENVLLGEIFKLSREKKKDFYPFFNSVKGILKKTTKFAPEDLPKWSRYWSELQKTVGKSADTDSTVMNNAYIRMCRDFFHVLEPVTCLLYTSPSPRD